MTLIQLNKCIDKEKRYYGLKLIGIFFSFLVGSLVLMKFNFTFSILGAVIGYVLGASISTYWHKGYIQRWCYWNFPTQLFANRKLPRSCERKFL